MAGESARESARRQREKAERLSRSAELWERGAEGEQRTAEVLSELPAESWTVFHDLRWPGRRFANVDHVVVGPPGVFVVDTKNWSGAITVKDGVLRCNGYAKDREVSSASESALAISSLTPMLRADLVKPVLCFVRDEPLSGWARDVMVTSTQTLVQMLLSRPPFLSAEDLRHLTLDLHAGIRSATEVTPSPVVTRSRRALPSFTPPPRANARSRSRRTRRTTGLLPALAVLLAMAVFIGNQDLRQGFGDLVSGLLTTGLAEQPDQPQDTPSKKKCQRNPQLDGCEQRQPK